MRIVQLVEHLEMGGLERLVIDLAVAHKAAGHQPLVYCLYEPGMLAAEARAADIPVMAFHKKPGFSWRTLWALRRQLRRDAPEVLHTHNPGVHHYGALAACLARVPVIVNTRHGPASSRGHLYQERYFRAVMPFTGAVVYVCDDSRRILEARGLPRRKSRVIVNGIPIERFLARPAAPGSARPRIRFGTVGRMVPVKAHAVLLDAFALLRRRLPEAELRIVGGGPLMGELAAQAHRLGLEDCVHLEGLAPDSAEIYRELDVFVFSSVSEGLPLVILEAMAAGLPVVSTRVGGIPEVAPEGRVSWFCPLGDPKPLAEMMHQAAVCGDLAQRGEAARQIAAARYGIAEMQRNYEALFRELLGS